MDRLLFAGTLMQHSRLESASFSFIEMSVALGQSSNDIEADLAASKSEACNNLTWARKQKKI